MASLLAKDAYLQGLARRICAQPSPEPQRRKSAGKTQGSETARPPKKKRKRPQKKSREREEKAAEPRAQTLGEKSLAASRAGKPAAAKDEEASGSTGGPTGGLAAEPDSLFALDVLRRRLHEKIQEARGQVGRHRGAVSRRLGEKAAAEAGAGPEEEEAEGAESQGEGGQGRGGHAAPAAAAVRGTRPRRGATAGAALQQGGGERRAAGQPRAAPQGEAAEAQGEPDAADGQELPAAAGAAAGAAEPAGAAAGAGRGAGPGAGGQDAVDRRAVQGRGREGPRRPAPAAGGPAAQGEAARAAAAPVGEAHGPRGGQDAAAAGPAAPEPAQEEGGEGRAAPGEGPQEGPDPAPGPAAGRPGVRAAAGWPHRSPAPGCTSTGGQRGASKACDAGHPTVYALRLPRVRGAPSHAGSLRGHGSPVQRRMLRRGPRPSVPRG